MIRLTIDKLQPGMVTARNIYSVTGNLLLGNNITLDAQLISRLGNLGIDSVYIKHPYLEVEPEEILHETTRRETIKLTHQTFEGFRKTQSINIAGIREAIKKIVEDTMDHRHVLIHLTDIRTHDDYTFGHSINVCLLSVMLGIKLGLNRDQLYDLALGAILHDLGKMLVHPDILNKQGDLTSEEWRIMQRHSAIGFNILRQTGAVPLSAAHIPFQHHENFDGSGYSQGLAGEAIHKYARIVAVADLYDAVTSDRPYRKAFLPHEAYEIVVASRGSKLDPQLTDTFLENVALYPLGTTVLLDTGETGVVIKVYPKLQARPVVKIIADRLGRTWTGPEKTVDLTRDLVRFIIKVLKPEEIFQHLKMSDP